MDGSKLSIKRDKDIIIPRALYVTTKASFLNDIKGLELYYTSQQIVKTLKTTKSMISNEVCKLISERYNIQPFYRFEL